MKPFDEWARELADQVRSQEAAQEEPENPDYLLRCCCCGEWFDGLELGLEVDDITSCQDSDNFYCGSSPRCCP